MSIIDRDTAFTNELTSDNVTRALNDAARRLESAAKDLREFAASLSEIEPGAVTESMTHILPDNVAHLSQSALMDVNSASRHLLDAVRYSGQYRVSASE
jgi:hypothetical protein